MDLRAKAASGLKWSAIERLTTQAMQLIVMLVLANMIGPKAFGLVGMLAVFIALSQVFVDAGFSSALIRKVDCTEADFSTAFYFNVLVAVTCYAVLYIAAPLIASFYQLDELTELLRILGLNVVFSAFSVIQRAKLTIEMDFKTQAKASLLSALLSSSVAISMAYHGFGVWALIAQMLIMSACNSLFLMLFHPWWPKERFSRDSFNYMFGFGSKLLLSGLIDTLYKNIYQLIIGKAFSAKDVGYFTQANQLTMVPAATLTTVIQRVTYPLLSHIQNEAKRLDQAYLMTLRLAALVIFPLIVGIGAIATPLIHLVLGEQWVDSIPYVMLLCIGFMLMPIHAINLNILQVKGRSDLFLKLEIIKKSVTTVMLIVTVPLGVKAICIGIAIQSYIALLINTYYTGKLTTLSPIKQLINIFPIWCFALLSNALAYWTINNITQSYSQQLLGTIIVAISLYFLMLVLFERDLIKQFTRLIKPSKA
ncbi:lipopolysaccharide biosynthesis protein [Pseudoalteromonas sp. T1lg88]|uniref:lipopolysaccharide biosynthesis protein n=1 Tax=Pseudoalteromonas sp. T1lg88 TaxID=2077104 RepID=UPI000CF62FA3|nr:lipopolysaccharide biosynthesis protein [Pseudoalteromonas sp. T1lg88]